jgi:hypothetical protein
VEVTGTVADRRHRGLARRDRHLLRRRRASRFEEEDFDVRNLSEGHHATDIAGFTLTAVKTKHYSVAAVHGELK